MNSFSTSPYNPYVWNLAWYYTLRLPAWLSWMRQWTKPLVLITSLDGIKNALNWAYTCHLKVRLGLLENFLWGAKPFLGTRKILAAKRRTRLDPVLKTIFLFPLVPGWSFLAVSVPLRLPVFFFKSNQSPYDTEYHTCPTESTLWCDLLFRPWILCLWTFYILMLGVGNDFIK